MNEPATSPATRSRQETALTRAKQAHQLRAEHPEMTLEEIGAAVGVSKQRVGQMFKAPPEARWPEEILEEMCGALESGKTPQDLLAIPGVAERITALRPRNRGKEDADREQDRRRLGSLRKMICVGAHEPEGTAGRRLYDARQAGLARVLAGWSEAMLVNVEKALRAGSKYAEVLSEVPQLGEALGVEHERAATMLRVLVEAGEDAEPGTRERRLYDARQASA